MPKNGFPLPTAKNVFQILNLHSKKHVFKKYPFFNANLLEKFHFLRRKEPILSYVTRNYEKNSCNNG